ncbi:MAG: RNase adapter RapZ [Paraclostridium bifermentans]|uniref:p-loop ATPase family protein n=2 Tax=Paraclostridium bifermentans TaxID=1490 RepID=T4VKU7_PARBF|nr:MULTISPECIES: RNase adapter RapZ [Paraclostridium]EQK41401.1 P-loop ATPase family protein [[Clostridium] bifermentans ATCC 638] [Paraclostridium bifermentans ATCC 638 = DSM 14991]MBN8048092.1 RNase adapter RapZ [Paraclostridium bifermentans]MBS6507069.1 RNase adapter RapZ [Paraclostridium bifermentans]MBZ6005404.1 RNase adapter RapZ [Paraclostridium bifermentans]MDU0295329.1 RNase adapter RapZ [Paraclostridium sp. MRS3W1]
MRFIIVTGLSGSGKSEAMKSLEDIGFYCVDNLPPTLITKFAELCYQGNSNIDKVALGIDIRGREFFETLHESLSYLEKENYKYEVLFLDCADDILVKRYKMTRRNHPLAKSTQITEGIKEEREILQTLRDKADSIIDTSNMKPRDLKDEISKLYIEGEKTPKLTISVVSFGFKHGIPIDSDLVFDVRFLPNPYYVEELRPQTGEDQVVRDYVMDSDVSREFFAKLEDMVDFLIPHYIEEGKNHLVIAIGCTGGRHRSVTISNLLYDDLIKKGYRVVKKHRDYTLR